MGEGPPTRKPLLQKRLAMARIRDARPRPLGAGERGKRKKRRCLLGLGRVQKRNGASASERGERSRGPAPADLDEGREGMSPKKGLTSTYNYGVGGDTRRNTKA